MNHVIMYCFKAFLWLDFLSSSNSKSRPNLFKSSTILWFKKCIKAYLTLYLSPPSW